MTVLADAVVVSNFAAAGRLELLRALFETIYLAVPVYREVQDGIAAGYGFLSQIGDHVDPDRPDGWLRLTDIEGTGEQTLRATMPRRLHDGEATSIAIAMSRGWRLLTDDRDARNFATRSGVAVSGTLGLLVLLVERKMLTLSSANDVLAEMIRRAGYRSPIADIGSLLPDSEET
ncbi:MAG: hypothetical protein HYX51_08000 [Chloroflexi bacterium]|nr:hypothetical protein [Chloroflexota bacterium]